ncbi:hypothetical protein F383_32348 [Gossypium arboreum]|uniref:Uncharacterized protein n=1 Tax=Gossypium arboreum TaxID=29729 RepID=A0A0B0N327_GOSAR|nr:hypothetical protein F383_32348 [Gossypium arboreum]
MGQHTKSTRSRPPHTGKPHGRVNLAELKHDSHRWTTRSCLFNKLDHGLKHSKAYKYTLEEEKREVEKGE